MLPKLLVLEGDPLLLFLLVVLEKPDILMSLQADVEGRPFEAICHICIFLVLLDPGGLLEGREVEEGKKLLAVIVTADAEDLVVPGLNRPDIRLGVKDAVFGANLLHPEEGLVNAALAGLRVVAERDLVPVKFSAVQITAVHRLHRVVMVGVIVELADLVAAVEHRDAALGHQEGMEHEVKADGQVMLPLVLLHLGRLDAAKGSRRSAKAGVAQTRVVIIQLTAGVASPPFAGQVVVEVLLVGDLLLAKLAEEIIVKPPADVVVAAEVVQEDILLREREDRVHLVAEQPDVAGRDRVPHGAHGRDVVEHVALGLFDRAEVRDHLGGLHDDFAEKERAGADDLAGHAHDAHQRVHLREVPALRAELLPNIRNRVEADDINSVVAEVQHIARHVVEHDRVAVIEIPLVGVEGGHDDFAQLREFGKVSRRGRWEDLRNRLLELTRDVPVVEEEVTILVLRLAGPCSDRPFMVLARMVHHEVKADADAVVVALIGKGRKVLHRAKLRLHRAEIGNRITAVAPVLGALQKGHEMQVVDARLLQVVQVAAHAFQRPCKAAGIHQHAKEVVALVPVRIRKASLVPGLQLCRTAVIELVEHVAKIIKCQFVAVVELPVEPLHLIVNFFKAGPKDRIPRLIDHSHLLM